MYCQLMRSMYVGYYALCPNDGVVWRISVSETNSQTVCVWHKQLPAPPAARLNKAGHSCLSCPIRDRVHR